MGVMYILSNWGFYPVLLCHILLCCQGSFKMVGSVLYVFVNHGNGLLLEKDIACCVEGFRGHIKFIICMENIVFWPTSKTLRWVQHRA